MERVKKKVKKVAKKPVKKAASKEKPSIFVYDKPGKGVRGEHLN
jgi:hypothetical protein